MVSSKNKISPKAGKFYIILLNLKVTTDPGLVKKPKMNNRQLLLDFFVLWRIADYF